MKKMGAMSLRSIIFPNCASQCAAVEYFGAGECECICPFKFDRFGKPVKFLVDNSISEYQMISENGILPILGDSRDNISLICSQCGLPDAKLGYSHESLFRYLWIGCDRCGRYESTYTIKDLIERWSKEEI